MQSDGGGEGDFVLVLVEQNGSYSLKKRSVFVWILSRILSNTYLAVWACQWQGQTLLVDVNGCCDLSVVALSLNTGPIPKIVCLK